MSNSEEAEGRELMLYRTPGLPEATNDSNPTLEAAPERELWYYLHVLLKYRSVVGTIFAGVVAVCALYAFSKTPQYSAQATIRIDVYEPVLGSMKLEDFLQQKSSRQDYLETQIQQITSLSLADAVLKDPIIRSRLEAQDGGWRRFLPFSSGSNGLDPQTGDAVSGYSASAQTIRKYLDMIVVTPVRRTTLVKINVTHPDKEFATLVANRHATAYIDWVRNLRVDQQARGLSFLASQATELRERVNDLERQLADYAETNAIVALNKDENITVQKMAAINQQLAVVTGKTIESANKAAQARIALKRDSAAFDDQTVLETRTELSKVQSEYAELSGKFEATYPKMVQLKGQIQGLERAVRQQREAIVRGLETEAQSSSNQEKALREELERQQSQAFDLSKRQVEYNALSRELETSRELQQSVSLQMKEMSLAVESNGSNIAIVDRALVPRTPSEPKKMLIITLGCFVGFVGGICIAFLLNHLDNTIRTPDDVKTQMQLPTLGVIPSFSMESMGLNNQSASESNGVAELVATKGDDSKPRLSKFMAQASNRFPALVNNLRSPVSEAYRTIRTNIILSRAGRSPRRLLVTSAVPSEGKTTVSVNLALTLASTGATVAVVDSDLRKPSVHVHFQVPLKSIGVSDVITGNATLDQAIVPTPFENVFLIPSGRPPPNPAELIGSPQMQDMLEQLSARFDYVIVDSAPLLPVTDTMLLTRQVDGVVLVIRGGATPAKASIEAKARAASTGAHLLGVVLNDVDMDGRDYYYYHYNGYYGSYYHDDGSSARRDEAANA